jgi:uncharacterized protein YdcH (DUF465 family)
MFDAFYDRLLDEHLERYFSDIENTREGLTDEEIEELMENFNWTGSRCHY